MRIKCWRGGGKCERDDCVMIWSSNHIQLVIVLMDPKQR